MDFLILAIGCIFVNNILLMQYLGNCPFLGVSKKMETATGMAIPALYAGLGIFLPLITTNCAVMGVCLINIKEEYTFLQALVSSFSYAVGFGLALVLFAAVRERILLARVPKPLQDTSIGLVSAGILSLAFFAFKGMV